MHTIPRLFHHATALVLMLCLDGTRALSTIVGDPSLNFEMHVPPRGAETQGEGPRRAYVVGADALLTPEEKGRHLPAGPALTEESLLRLAERTRASSMAEREAREKLSHEIFDIGQEIETLNKELEMYLPDEAGGVVTLDATSSNGRNAGASLALGDDSAVVVDSATPLPSNLSNLPAGSVAQPTTPSVQLTQTATHKAATMMLKLAQFEDGLARNVTNKYQASLISLGVPVTDNRGGVLLSIIMLGLLLGLVLLPIALCTTKGWLPLRG